MKVILSHHSLNTPGGGEKVCLTTLEAIEKSNCDTILATTERIDWNKAKQYYEKRFDVPTRVA